MRTLVLFDIDGTILHGGGLGRECLLAAVDEALLAAGRPRLHALRTAGTAGNPAAHPIAGKTDLQFLHETLLPLIGPEALAEIISPVFDLHAQNLIQHFTAQRGVVLLPGVRELIAALEEREDCCLGLLTGNIEAGARAKLAVFDLNHHFSLGAFGDEALLRRELPPIALRKARERHAVDFQPEAVAVIGDTPNDVDCARPLGLRSIAVATGPYRYRKPASGTTASSVRGPPGHGRRRRRNHDVETFIGSVMHWNRL